MEKTYNPKQAEEKWYDIWEKNGYFTPEIRPNGQPYSIVMPPPNVTGTLHLGHAVMLAIEDILIRYHRMLGDKTLWLPGTDHAAIATQAKVESDLYKKEGKSRRDFSREEFLKIVEKFASDSHDTIVNQVRSMGASCDWNREAYTLDEPRVLAVRTAFKRMYEAGLIYRGARIVNWDPKLQTTVSDDEIEWKDETGKLYYLQYGPFTIATARPETKFGDKYVVMHPNDERYKQYKHGQRIDLEWINGPVIATVIKDDVIDMEFGTGAMTITPWHDATDFEIAQRHKLDKEQIIDFNGKLLPIAGEFAGQHISRARLSIVEKLQQKGLVQKVEDNYSHRIATNSRGGGLIEPQIKEQWFIDVNKPFKIEHSELKGIKIGNEVTLKKLMRQVVESGQIKIIPKHFEKIYYHWIDNLRDWCISRQIVYGHRIPVWYCGEANSTLRVARSKDSDATSSCLPIVTERGVPEKCPNCGSTKLEQDPDTLDTWFSSGLWTFSTLGWPNETEDLKTFHPTDVLETGYDILFFWVARMILMTTYHVGQVPFHTVYLHGLVRDKDRQKMSKSKGNVIDPLGVIDMYGADALRFALIYGNTAGNDIIISEEKIRGMRNFANKIWNIARFVDMKNQESGIRNHELKDLNELQALAIHRNDMKIIQQTADLVQSTTKALDSYNFNAASAMLYEFIWHTFADKHIEDVKDRIDDNSLLILNSLFAILLKLLHPFMPFITEEIYQKFSDIEPSIMVAKWPSKAL